MEIVWKRNHFLKFFSQLKIRVGGQHPFEIMPGEEFEFDGTICKYAGSETANPQMRGAIRSGWAKLEGSDSEDVEAYSPARAVAKSQTKTTDLSRVQRTQPQHVETSSLDEDTVLTVQDRKNLPRDQQGRMTGHLTAGDNRKSGLKPGSTAGQRSMVASASDYDMQDNTTVAHVKSPKNLKIDVTSNPGAARDIEMRTREGGYGVAHGLRSRNSVIHQEGVDIKMNVGSIDRNVVVGDESDGEVIAHVRHSDKNHSSEGVHVKDTSSIRNKPIQKPAVKTASKQVVAKKAAPKAPVKAASKSPAKPAKPVPVVDISTLPPKIRVARRIDPTFPTDWSFEGKLAERLDRVKSHGISTEFLEALYAAEGDPMRRKLEEEFPSQFGG